MDPRTLSKAKGGDPVDLEVDQRTDRWTRPWHTHQVVLGLVGATLAVWGLTALGVWVAPLVVAFLWAMGVSGTWRQYGGALLLGAGGYLLPLAIAAPTVPVGRTSQVVASIMGFGTHGTGLLVWLLTAITAALLAVAGAWVGHASRQLVLARSTHPDQAHHSASGS